MSPFLTYADIRERKLQGGDRMTRPHKARNAMYIILAGIGAAALYHAALCFVPDQDTLSGLVTLNIDGGTNVCHGGEVVWRTRPEEVFRGYLVLVGFKNRGEAPYHCLRVLACPGETVEVYQDRVVFAHGASKTLHAFVEQRCGLPLSGTAVLPQDTYLLSLGDGAVPVQRDWIAFRVTARFGTNWLWVCRWRWL